MFKQTLAVAALAIVAAAPANAASLPTALAGLMSAGRDATRVYVLPTGTALLPPLSRIKALQPVAPGTSPNQPFPALPGLAALSKAGSQGSGKLVPDLVATVSKVGSLGTTKLVLEPRRR